MIKPRRNDDCVQSTHLHWLGILVIILFLISLAYLHTTPKFFLNKVSPLVRSLNTRNLEKYAETLNSEINSITSKHSTDNFSAQTVPENILAKSYVVYDVKNQKVLFEKNPDLVLPLASLTKVVSALTATSLVNDDKTITIDSQKMRADETLSSGLQNGQKWSLVNLLRYALTISSNASMDIIASTIFQSNSVFVDKMNQYVKDLGFQHFHFNSASGLDYGQVIGGEGTALEYAQLFAKAYTIIPQVLAYTTHSSINIQTENKKIYAIPNTNQEASKTTGLLASKTGFTDAAGGNLAILVNLELDRPIVIVVLGSTETGRFQAVDQLLDLTKSSLY